MADIEAYITRLANSAKQPQNYRWLVPLIVFIILFFTLRSCFSSNTSREGHYVIARDVTWYPLNFYGKDKNITAFSDDLMIEIARRKRLEIKLVTANPGDLLEYLDDTADAVFTSLTPDVNLQERYQFSEPYYGLGTVLVTDLQSTATSLEDMKWKYIGIRRGSAILYAIPNRPDFTVIPYDNLNVMLEDIVRDKIDGALVNQLNAYNFTNSYFKGQLKVATAPLTREGLRLMSDIDRKGTVLIEAFNEGITEMKADGTWAELLKKWDLYDPSIYNKQISK